MDLSKRRWWKDSVGYIIYPSTFKDSNGDGIGDLMGIVSKLDYLKELGIDFLWICPFFQSPMDDNGYDVSDYLNVDPLYGTNEDFKLLIAEAHKRGMRIVVDFVLNHTSDEHEWFKKALADPTSKERDYYIFRKGKYVDGKLVAPNNWASFFTDSAWEQVPDTDDFYFHTFSRKMPDVNWTNPALREKYYEIADYYISLGVDGFRMDALAHLAKDMSFEDSSLPVSESGTVLDTSKFSNRPELFSYLREFKEKGIRGRDIMLLGEVGGCVTPEDGLRMSNRKDGPLNLVFNFDTVWNNGNFGSIGKRDEEIVTNVIQLKHNFLRWYKACHEGSDMPFYWCNHDHPRLVSQYGDLRYRNESAKALFLTGLFLYGTPFVYQGEEIGMGNLVEGSIEDFRSDIGTKDAIDRFRKEGYSEETILSFVRRAGRLNARTAVQWDKGPYAGFSSVAPKMPLNGDYLKGVNVLSEMEDPYSILNFYQFAISLRKDPFFKQAVEEGPLEIVDYNHPDVFSYIHWGNTRLMVITNLRAYEVKFTMNYKIGDLILHNYDSVILDGHVLTLRPFESLLLAIR